jgi:RMKL-like, methyltransferase domain/DNA methylase
MAELLNKFGENMISETKNPADVIQLGMYYNLFSEGFEISPNLSEVYELALAYYESKILTKEELIKNSAYFIKVNNEFTNHYFICTGDPVKIPEYSSSRLKSFFINNQFRTGYATHGLFPYRGKFHPQMIKAIINIMGVKPNDTILDPMMGSGTVPVEAALMGIKAIGIDASPFCRFMAQTKCDALEIKHNCLNGLINKYESLFSDFNSGPKNFSGQIEIFLKNNPSLEKFDSKKIFNLIFLAFLDSEGYAQRSKRKPHIEHFKSILERYIAAVNKIALVENHLNITPAKTILQQGDARALDIESNSIDGILFSPPYSFAIDYLENDFSHLKYFEKNIATLKKNMIGMQGKSLNEKYSMYLEDMDKVISECSRVLKKGRFCTIIIGTNDSQLSKALKIPKENVSGLNKVIINIALSKGLSHIRSLPRQIVGMANTMRQEYIVIFQK